MMKRLLKYLQFLNCLLLHDSDDFWVSLKKLAYLLHIFTIKRCKVNEQHTPNHAYKKICFLNLNTSQGALSTNVTNGLGSKIKDCEMDIRSYKKHFSIESILFNLIPNSSIANSCQLSP